MSAIFATIGGLALIFILAYLWRRAKGDKSPLIEDGYQDENGYHSGSQP